MAHITLLGKFKSILFCILILLFIFNIKILRAEERFEFKLGDKIQILSDKGYRHTAANRFEAVGNVIITHSDKAIYGEKASVSMDIGETIVEGNVRYIGPDMTMYGSKLTYNFHSQKMDFFNGRIISDNYIILGKILSKTGPNTIYGEDAEYTTCRDCPESWSILGRKVNITIGEYIHIQHAFIKSKGVVILYIPYMVLPIKKKRETGLLFPRFSFVFQQGLRFQQPFFWNLAEHKDITITPSLWGSRGQGSELQYRQMLGDNEWVQIDSLHSWDRFYEEGIVSTAPTGNRIYRNYLEYEQMFITNNNLTHHTYLTGLNDLDTVRDYDQFIGNKFTSADTGLQTHVDAYPSLVNLTLEAGIRRNLLVDSAKEFDYQYVQMLPRVGYSLTPFTLWDSGPVGMRKATVNILGDFTNFKQMEVHEEIYTRNAYRSDNKAIFNLLLGQLGPVTAITKAQFESQYYHFPKEPDERYFQKYSSSHESEISLELEKSFATAYDAYYSAKDVELIVPKDNKNEEKEKIIIGKLPPYQKSFLEDRIKVRRSGYRHSQHYKLKHYYISDQKFRGSNQFLNQIRNLDGSVNSNGLFDPSDVIKGKENNLNYLESRTGIPTSNTLELQWNNNLYKKTPQAVNPYADNIFLKDQFSYSQLSYFNVSQGYDFNIESDLLVDHLTRLAITGGVTLGSLGFYFSEYYYHRNNNHISRIGVSKNYNIVKFNGELIYDSFTLPINKTANIGVQFNPIDTTALSYSYAHDIERKLNISSRYALAYTPHNNCWKTEIALETNQIQKRISFNFLLNYNNNVFVPFGAQ